MQLTIPFPGDSSQLLLFTENTLRRLTREYEEATQDRIREFQELIRIDKFKEKGCVTQNFSNYSDE